MARPKASLTFRQQQHVDDGPDAFVYRGDDNRTHWFCVHCATTPTADYAGWWQAHQSALDHLQYAHARRRVWVEHANPAHMQAVQAALPIVLAHHTQRGANG